MYKRFKRFCCSLPFLSLVASVLPQRGCHFDNHKRATRCVHSDGSIWWSKQAGAIKNEVIENSHKDHQDRHKHTYHGSCISIRNCTGIDMYQNGILADLAPWILTGISKEAVLMGTSWRTLGSKFTKKMSPSCKHLPVPYIGRLIRILIV